MREIHACGWDGHWIYREWSTIVDAYTTGELTEEEMRDRFKGDWCSNPNWIDERLERARAKGTSSMVYTRRDGLEPDEPVVYWEAERVQR